MPQMRLCKDQTCAERICRLQRVRQQPRRVRWPGDVRPLRRAGAVRKRLAYLTNFRQKSRTDRVKVKS